MLTQDPTLLMLYPATGLPYWSGVLTRWNTRSGLAALTPYSSDFTGKQGLKKARLVLD